MIRVFSIPDGNKLYQFRRGSYPAKIYSMSFNLVSSLLCVSSDTETVHIFKLPTGNSPPLNGNHVYGRTADIAGYGNDGASPDSRGRSSSVG